MINNCSPARVHVWEVSEVRWSFIVIIVVPIVVSIIALLKDLHLSRGIKQGVFLVPPVRYPRVSAISKL